MRILVPGLVLAAIVLLMDRPVMGRTWAITSPDLRQTFAYGSEQHRQWIARGNHLGIYMEFTNDPYVDRVNIRQYDDFDFNFPQIRLGADGKTYFYRSAAHGAVPVAMKHDGLFGDSVSLLPSSYLVVEKRHGLLRLTLLVSNSAMPVRPDGISIQTGTE